jgi:hypothetical protein
MNIITLRVCVLCFMNGWGKIKMSKANSRIFLALKFW